MSEPSMLGEVARAIRAARDTVRRAMFPRRSGPPVGSRAIDDVAAAYRRAVVALRGRGQRVTLQAIATEMQVGLSTLQRWRQDLALPYPPPVEWRGEISD